MRIALGIQYNGAHYHGWQKQPQTDQTIQQQLEAALAFVADQAIHTVCAGRTDAGVHAAAQVVHFDTDVVRPDHAWVVGTNTCLPKDIRVVWARVVPDTFHARFSALSRTYRYLIDNKNIHSPFHCDLVTFHRKNLDEYKMREAMACLKGKHDFNAYRASSCQSHSSVREVQFLNLAREGDRLTFTITANAFLHHMVRNIMGVLIAIGEGKKPPIWAKEVLESRSREIGGNTALPHGLYLVGVEYPEEYSVPGFRFE